MTPLMHDLTREAAAPHLHMTCSADGAVALIRHRFDASEGVMGRPTQLRLALAMEGGGRLRQQPLAGPALDAVWATGQFNLVLPGQAGRYASPSVEVLGLAVDWPSLHAAPVELDALAPLVNGLHRDAAVSALLHALWAAARCNLLSDALLGEGALAVLRRLAQLARHTRDAPRVGPSLTPDQLLALIDYLDASRDSRPAVARMAEVVGMETTRFGRAIQGATGMSPYVFLTHRRMQWARVELARGRTVTDVALAVGYANASKFAAAFRRVNGVCPSAARNAHLPHG